MLVGSRVVGFQHSRSRQAAPIAFSNTLMTRMARLLEILLWQVRQQNRPVAEYHGYHRLVDAHPASDWDREIVLAKSLWNSA